MSKMISAVLALSSVAGVAMSAEGLGDGGSADPLADLGLGLEDQSVAAAEAPVTEAAASEDAAVPARAPRKEVEIADLDFGFADFVPTQKRGGGERGSKYDFDNLVAPVAKEDGSGFKYATFTALPADPANADIDALKRSVQSATTQANRAAKEAGRPNYYVTRQAIKDGEVVGVTVYRVDATIAKEAATE